MAVKHFRKLLDSKKERTNERAFILEGKRLVLDAFYSDADILLCDEMTSALDVTTQAQVVELLQDLKKDGRLSAVFVSHDIALVSMLCDRVMVMKDGKCVEEGDTLTVIKHPCADYTKELLESARRQSIQELSE